LGTVGERGQGEQGNKKNHAEKERESVEGRLPRKDVTQVREGFQNWLGGMSCGRTSNKKRKDAGIIGGWGLNNGGYAIGGGRGWSWGWWNITVSGGWGKKKRREKPV